MIAFAIAIVAYVLGSIGYYSIAKRRGIHHAWLAWVPVGSMWLTGCISDHFQSFAKGKVKNKRTVLLVLSIIQTLAVIAVLVLFVLMVVQTVAMEDFYSDEQYFPGIYDQNIYAEDVYGDYYDYYDAELPASYTQLVGGMMGAYVVLLLVSLPMAIVRYIALYDVFASCDPNNAVVYLLLSIFLGIDAFLVFACREKDAPMAPPPVYPGYQMPYGVPPQPPQPRWPQPPIPSAPPAPPAEPWEQENE